MNQYEAIIIIDSELAEDARTSLIERFKNMIDSAGQLGKIDEWGDRKLAYPINDKTDGYYLLVNFSAPPDFPSELERVLKITDGILKFLIIRKDD